MQRLPFYGVAVLCVDDANVRAILADIAKPVVTYGLARTRNCAPSMSTTSRGGCASSRIAPDWRRSRSTSRSPAFTTCETRWRRSPSVARPASPTLPSPRALAEFKGVGRRFERYGDVALAGGGAFTLIDDYGHHPVEMAATIDAARGSFPGRRIVLAFQPHRYTRTRDLFEDFVQVLSSVDALVLAEVYPAGEAPIVAADGRSLARAMRVAGHVEPVFVECVAEIADAIRDVARDGDVVLTMGAGSIGQVAAQLTQ